MLPAFLFIASEVRAGTKNVPAIVGFARAIQLVGVQGKRGGTTLAYLRDLLLRGIVERIGGVWLDGDPAARLPGNLHSVSRGSRVWHHTPRHRTGNGGTAPGGIAAAAAGCR